MKCDVVALPGEEVGLEDGANRRHGVCTIQRRWAWPTAHLIVNAAVAPMCLLSPVRRRSRRLHVSRCRVAMHVPQHPLAAHHTSCWRVEGRPSALCLGGASLVCAMFERNVAPYFPLEWLSCSPV